MTNRPTPRWILPIAAALVLTITAICWAQETILPDALVWPQFVVGELPDAVTALDVVSPPRGASVQISGIEVRQDDGPFSLLGE